MSKKDKDFRFFGPAFQEQNTDEASQAMIEEVGVIADGLVIQHGVETFDKLPQEAKDQFARRVNKISWKVAIEGIMHE